MIIVIRIDVLTPGVENDLVVIPVEDNLGVAKRLSTTLDGIGNTAPSSPVGGSPLNTVLSNTLCLTNEDRRTSWVVLRRIVPRAALTPVVQGLVGKALTRHDIVVAAAASNILEVHAAAVVVSPDLLVGSLKRTTKVLAHAAGNDGTGIDGDTEEGNVRDKPLLKSAGVREVGGGDCRRSQCTITLGLKNGEMARIDVGILNGIDRTQVEGRCGGGQRQDRSEDSKALHVERLEEKGCEDFWSRSESRILLKKKGSALQGRGKREYAACSEQ